MMGSRKKPCTPIIETYLQQNFWFAYNCFFFIDVKKNRPESTNRSKTDHGKLPPNYGKFTTKTRSQTIMRQNVYGYSDISLDNCKYNFAK